MFHIKKKNSFKKRTLYLLLTFFFANLKLLLKKKKPIKILKILIGCSIDKIDPQKVKRAHKKAVGEYNRSTAPWFRQQVQSFPWDGKIPWGRAW